MFDVRFNSPPNSVQPSRTMQLAHAIPTILRADPATGTTWLRARQVMPMVIIAGAIHGGVMGSFAGTHHDRFLQILYSAEKVPMLLAVSFCLTIPSFFMLNTLLGMRGDFRLAVRAVVNAQAGLAITLASLSPFVALFYASTTNYAWAILFNGGMFAIATLAGQTRLRKLYRPLIESNPRHRRLLMLWMLVYIFIAIQMAWVLRPFVGGAGETSFFRKGAWGNAYVMVWELMAR